jgi:hypothetical protein
MSLANPVAPLAARRSAVSGTRCALPQAARRVAVSTGVRCQAAPAKTAAPAVSEELVMKSVNAIRFLAIDGVEKANSGHPGLPMGCAPMTYVLFREAMKFNPKNPAWFNRDRFVLSAGHGSMLQYAMLHLCGYDSVKVRLPRVCDSSRPTTGGCPAHRVRCWARSPLSQSWLRAPCVWRLWLCRWACVEKAHPLLVVALTRLCGPQIEDLQQFRQWGSKTPGHPENFITPGVEVTTGAVPASRSQVDVKGDSPGRLASKVLSARASATPSASRWRRSTSRLASTRRT